MFLVNVFGDLNDPCPPELDEDKKPSKPETDEKIRLMETEKDLTEGPQAGA
jgi:hypothetical protein